MQRPGRFTVSPTSIMTHWNGGLAQALRYTCAQALRCVGAASAGPPWLRLRADGKCAGFHVTLSPEEQIRNIALKEMVDLLPLTFYILNTDQRLMMWNKRVEQATQLSGEELAHIDALALFPPQDRAAVANRVAEVFEHDGEVIVEAGLRSKDGHVSPYLFTGTRILAGGRPYLCGMGMDLTERRRQEERLRLAERALHASSNGIYITRCAGASNPIEYVNPAFERITGYRADEVLGIDSHSLCGFLATPGMDECQFNDVQRAMREKREIRITLRSMRKTGEVFWNDLTIAPVLDDKAEVTHFVSVINDVTATKQRTFYLEHEINHDGLTGLANRNLMWDRLEQALHVAQRNKTLVAIILVDLDNFKSINDTLGHDAGDEVLRIIARKMQVAVRDSDTVARLGGDEFVLILANQPSLRYTLRMIDRLRSDIVMAVSINGKEIPVESSMGVSIFPHDGKNAADLMRSADIAMYHAKAAGRNDVHFFSPDMKETTEAKHKFEQHMRQAVANNEMFLMLQPKVSLLTGKILGAEALLRWRHPQLGVLLPASFLREAEENGQIVKFGEWVFKAVCGVLHRLKTLGHGGLVISMNVSFREFSQRDYISLLGVQLADSALAPETFELEITESNLLRNAELTHDILSDISRLGIRLTVDEFGAGVSSLRNLQQLPVTNLKIFKPYIDNLSRDNISDMMAKTIIGIGHLMNVGVIGEGVETAGQLDFLKLNGCDQIQGNYFSEPVPLAAFERLLQQPAHGLPH
jgi:diguanylate cyclase (GGDEF)-like protein/PAS domain S-box-containing protein